MRVAIGLTAGGLIALGAAAVGKAAQVLMESAAAIGPERLTGAIDVLSSAGLTLIAAGFIAPRLATAVDRPRRWLSAQIAVRRLSALADELAEAAPEWALRGDRTPTSLRDPSIRLYRQVILIRDASWTLLGSVDDALIAEAVTFARRWAGSDNEQAVAALAEACWLSHAVRVRRSGHGTPPHGDQDLVILDRASDEAIGSLDDEADFLVAVAGAWRNTGLIDRFLSAAQQRRG